MMLDTETIRTEVRLHEERRARLGMPVVIPRVRRPPPLIVRPQPIYERAKPLLTLPTTPVGPAGGEQWPQQPRPVFYDEAAQAPATTWQRILADACLEHDVPMPDLLGPRHFKDLVAARDQAAFRMVVECDMSYAAIGRKLGRDHTSITAALARYLRRTPGAAGAFQAHKAKLSRERQAQKEEAKRLYLHEGKTIEEIYEILPLSLASVRDALKEWREWQ